MTNLITYTLLEKQHKIHFVKSFDEIQSLTSQSFVYIIDKTIWDLYESELKKITLNSSLYFVCSKEGLKTWRTAEKIIYWLMDQNLNRNGKLVAIGGGVIGDLVGFIASIYKRGIAWDFIPTTLMAQIDASIGGKTAINFRSAKNQLGAFHPPENVTVYIPFLETLPHRHLLSGYVEIAKVAMINSPNFFYELCKQGKKIFQNKSFFEKTVKKSIQEKLSIIGDDWFDAESGTRQLLNFGHTFGHAYETITRYRLLHGEAVALGMLTATRLSVILKKADQMIYDQLKEHWIQMGIPVREEFFWRKSEKIQWLINIIGWDKKNSSSGIRMILPYSVGDVRFYSTSIYELSKLSGIK